MLSEKVLNLFLVSIQDILAFLFKCSFNLLKLLLVVFSHVVELFSHCGNDGIDIIVFFFERFNIMVIFLLELFKELSDKVFFGHDNLLASFFLSVNVLEEEVR